MVSFAVFHFLSLSRICISYPSPPRTRVLMSCLHSSLCSIFKFRNRFTVMQHCKVAAEEKNKVQGKSDLESRPHDANEWNNVARFSSTHVSHLSKKNVSSCLSLFLFHKNKNYHCAKKRYFLRLNWLRVQNGFHFETFKQTINFYCVACFVHKWFLLFTFDKVIKEIFMPKRIAW